MAIAVRADCSCMWFFSSSSFFWRAADVVGDCMLAFVKQWVTFSISMYIMCVILRLFSALSHGIGTLQVSVVIIASVISFYV